MVTFEEARRIVEAALRPAWTPDDGTLYVAPYGWADRRYWRVEAGAEEYLVGGDPDFERLDAPAYLVEKATGDLVYLPVLSNFDRLGDMARVGDHPAD